MIRGAVLGLGKMGLSHASIVAAQKDVELVAVCDTSSVVLSGFKKYSDISTYSDYKKMLDKERDILLSFPQRGEVYRHHAQSVV